MYLAWFQISADSDICWQYGIGDIVLGFEVHNTILTL